MNLRRLLPLVLLPSLACVTASFTPLQPFSSPPRPVSSVELFRSGMPNRPYRQVGILRVRSSIGWDAAMQQLMETGADYGCDAVAGIDSGESTSVGISPLGGAFISQHDYITASCLLWTEGGPPQQVPPPPPPMPPPPVRSDQ